MMYHLKLLRIVHEAKAECAIFSNETASMDKCNITQKSHPLIVSLYAKHIFEKFGFLMLILSTTIIDSLSHEYH